MDNELTTKKDQFDVAFESMPLEVRNFMWSDAYTLILDGIQKVLNLTDQQKETVRLESYDLLVGLKDMPAVARDLQKEFDDEKVAKILYAINSEIIARAENITEFYSPNPEEAEASPQTAPSPSDMLARLNQTMTAPTTLAPTKREYSAAPQAPAKPSFDPYREIPDK